uniref:Uncharacterized protein n=1 Tax=Arundo donax TaxID=35708 RepID=A0A0A8Y0J8_ARUDO
MCNSTVQYTEKPTTEKHPNTNFFPGELEVILGTVG